MRTLAGRLLPLGLMTVLAVRDVGADPPVQGSQLPLRENQCALCHGRSDDGKGHLSRLYVSSESLVDDVHFRRGVNCHDCHGGDPHSVQETVAHSTAFGDAAVVPFRKTENELRRACATCHSAQAVDIVKGVHARVGDGTMRDTAHRCTAASAMASTCMACDRSLINARPFFCSTRSRCVASAMRTIPRLSRPRSTGRDCFSRAWW